jgi:hypothetical protein
LTQICEQRVWGPGGDIVPGSFTNCGHFSCQSCFVNPKECPVCQAPNNGSFDSVFGSFLLVPDDFDSIPDSVLHLFQGTMMHSLKSCLKLTSFPCRSGRNGEKKGGCD